MTVYLNHTAYAFSRNKDAGNPAGVVLLDEWQNDETLQKIATENNLPETAFIVSRECDEKSWDIRWFTPLIEVPLCGHATLAAAAVLRQKFSFISDIYNFHGTRDRLDVSLSGTKYILDLPVDMPDRATLSKNVIDSLGLDDMRCFQGRDYYLIEIFNEDKLRDIQPDFKRLKLLTENGIIITTQGRNVDFVSRFFAPAMGINEDHVTGSAHCVLVPFWAKRLARNELYARQLSPRGGYLECFLKNNRVLLMGDVCVDNNVKKYIID